MSGKVVVVTGGNAGIGWHTVPCPTSSGIGPSIRSKVFGASKSFGHKSNKVDPTTKMYYISQCNRLPDARYCSQRLSSIAMVLLRFVCWPWQGPKSS